MVNVGDWPDIDVMYVTFLFLECPCCIYHTGERKERVLRRLTSLGVQDESNAGCQ